MSQSVSSSPCINVCTLDRSGMCIGCGRMLDEIAAWSRMSAEQRDKVCTRARNRLEQKPASHPGPSPDKR